MNCARVRRVVLALFLPFALVACEDDGGNNGGTAVLVPGAPAGVQAVANGTTVTVSFTAGANADSHRVVLSTTGEADRTATTTESSVQFTDLTLSTTYAATVFAVNSAGEAAAPAVTVTIDDPVETFVEVTANILTDVTWTSDKVWVITRPIFVGVDCGTDGTAAGCVEATLTIEPGTTIVGNTDLPQGVRGAYLVVNRGSKIIADATQADRAPTEAETIVFTSDKPKGQRARGDWGGIIINGRAQTNAGAEAEGEGDSGLFGGNLDTDNSGVLRGVRIEFAGDDVTPTDQLNGLALQGVGSGTTISYLQIHYNVDDGIEPFGGTVSVDHMVVTGIGDDSVDGTDGYRGFMQFIVGQQRGDAADNGMELSNDGEDADRSPKSTAVIANATMVGAGFGSGENTLSTFNGDRGVQFREGSHYRVYNSIFTGFGDAGFCVENAGTVTAANARLGGATDPQTTLSIEGSVVWNNAVADGGDDNFEGCSGYSTEENKTFFETAGFNNVVADPLLRTGYDDIGTMMSPPDIVASELPAGYTPFDLTSVTLDDVNLFAPADGRTLVDTDYPGAVAPGTALDQAWFYGWTVWTEDGADSRANQAGS